MRGPPRSSDSKTSGKLQRLNPLVPSQPEHTGLRGTPRVQVRNTHQGPRESTRAACSQSLTSMKRFPRFCGSGRPLTLHRSNGAWKPGTPKRLNRASTSPKPRVFPNLTASTRPSGRSKAPLRIDVQPTMPGWMSTMLAICENSSSRRNQLKNSSVPHLEMASHLSPSIRRSGSISWAIVRSSMMLK